MNPSIVAIGSPVQDIFITSPALITGQKPAQICLPPGTKLDCQVTTTTGGNVANVAVTLGRSGLKPKFVGRTGSDLAGRNGRDELAANGVDVDELRLIPGQPTAQSVILVASDGERTILTDHGLELDPADWQPAINRLKAGDWLYLSSLGNPEILEDVIIQASDRGAQVAINPSSVELRQPEKLLAVADRLRLLIANREEMTRLWPGQKPAELAAAANLRIPTVVVTDGPRGSVAADNGRLYRAGLYKPELAIVDRTGAGDAFAGGFLFGLIKNRSIEDCLLFGAANSTSVVGLVGAQAGILSFPTNLDEFQVESTRQPSAKPEEN